MKTLTIEELMQHEVTERYSITESTELIHIFTPFYTYSVNTKSIIKIEERSLVIDIYTMGGSVVLFKEVTRISAVLF